MILALVLSSIGSAVFQLTTVRLSELLIGPYRESFAYVLFVILLGIALGSQLVQRFRVGFARLMVVNIIALAWMLGGLGWAMELFAQAYQTLSESYWQLVGLRLSLIAGLTLASGDYFRGNHTGAAANTGGSESGKRVRSPPVGAFARISPLRDIPGQRCGIPVDGPGFAPAPGLRRTVLLVAAAFSAASLVVIIGHGA